MKKTRFFLLAALLVAACNVSAQRKALEHNVYVSAGLFIDRNAGDTGNGLSVRLGYGLDIRLSQKLSVMPGIAVRGVIESPFESWDGADDDIFTFLDIPVIARYHLDSGKGGWVFGLGPVLSFCVDNDTYYIDAGPDPLTDKTKIKPFDLGLQPSVAYKLGRFTLGVDARIGLLNVKRTHGLTTGTQHLHDLTATVAFRF
ncbi:MAG: PorT family protein [Bacteroidaceae bacterium]|nr:PorT family protein [Bacteroidaceae bacterium]